MDRLPFVIASGPLQGNFDALKAGVDGVETGLDTRLDALEAPQEALTGLAFATNWTNFATSVPDASQALCGSWLDKSGNVHVQGLARRITAAFVVPNAVGTLTAAHRPTKTHGFNGYGVDGAGGQGVYRINIASDGVVTLISAVGAADGGVGTFFYLDGISFRLDA